MTIYTKPHPYVYICTHKITGHFYIGYREANLVPSLLDLPLYKTSSAIVRPNFDEYSWQIVAEFFDGNSAYDFEQQLIMEYWSDPLLLNGQHRHQCNGRFKSKKGRTVSEATKEKLRQANLGKVKSQESIEKMKQTFAKNPKEPWNKDIKTGPLTLEQRNAISDSLRGKPKSDAQRKKQSVAMKGSTPWNKGLVGSQVAWNKGVSCPAQTGNNNPAKRPEVREKLKQKALERWAKRKAGIAPACE